MNTLELFALSQVSIATAQAVLPISSILLANHNVRWVAAFG